jgi:hypothetical protein
MTPATLRYCIYRMFSSQLGTPRMAETNDTRPEWAHMHSSVPGNPLVMSVAFLDPYVAQDPETPKFRKFRITVEEIS